MKFLFTVAITVTFALGFISFQAQADDGSTSSSLAIPNSIQSSAADVSAAKPEEALKFSPNKSIYFFMPPAEMTAAKVSYSQSSLKDSRNGSTLAEGAGDSEFKMSNYNFSLSYSFDETSMAYLNAGFQSSEVVRPNDSTRYNVSNGMSDIIIGSQKLSKGEKTNWIFGGELGIPPEAKTNIGDTNSEGNASSGMWGLTPYLGTETNFAGGIAGVHASASFFIYSQQKEANGTTTASWYGSREAGTRMEPIYALNLYYEFAVAKPVKLGVSAGTTRNEQEGRPGNSWTNERQAKFYGEGRVWQDIFVNGSVGATTFDYGTARTMTTAQVGLKKLL